jgi:hypothetical protein
LCFQSDLLSAALYQQLVRQLKLQLESAGHEILCKGIGHDQAAAVKLL